MKSHSEGESGKKRVFFYWPELTLKYPVNWDASYHTLTLQNNKKISSYVGI